VRRRRHPPPRRDCALRAGSRFARGEGQQPELTASGAGSLESAPRLLLTARGLLSGFLTVFAAKDPPLDRLPTRALLVPPPRKISLYLRSTTQSFPWKHPSFAFAFACVTQPGQNRSPPRA